MSGVGAVLLPDHKGCQQGGEPWLSSRAVCRMNLRDSNEAYHLLCEVGMFLVYTVLLFAFVTASMFDDLEARPTHECSCSGCQTCRHEGGRPSIHVSSAAALWEALQTFPKPQGLTFQWQHLKPRPVNAPLPWPGGGPVWHSCKHWLHIATASGLMRQWCVGLPGLVRKIPGASSEPLGPML